MKTLTIGRQMAAGFAACLFGMVIVAIVATVTLHSAAAAKDRVLDGRVPLMGQSHQLATLAATESAALRGYLISNNEDLLVRRAALDRQFEQVLTDMRDASNDEELQAKLAEVSTARQEWRTLADQFVAERRDADGVAGLADRIEAELFPSFQSVQSGLADVVSMEERAIASETAASDEDQDRALTLLWIVVGVTLVAGLALAGWVTHRVAVHLTDLAHRMDGAAQDILAGVRQQVSGATEQAAAVQETVATVDELVQTAEQAVQRAQGVADRAQESVEVAEVGTRAVDDSSAGMTQIRSQVQTIAASITNLAQRAQSIGDVVDTVEQIAAETHLLALNAAIEAARAGEHGRGFAVVAGEVRNLADQSKSATSHVSRILGEIEEGTGAVILATEEGTKSSDHGAALVARAGETITLLAETIAAAALAAEQIAASSRQQAAATVQISEAMRNVDTVMEQNVASARQAETTAHTLSRAADEMKLLVGAK